MPWGPAIERSTFSGRDPVERALGATSTFFLPFGCGKDASRLGASLPKSSFQRTQKRNRPLRAFSPSRASSGEDEWRRPIDLQDEAFRGRGFVASSHCVSAHEPRAWVGGGGGGGGAGSAGGFGGGLRKGGEVLKMSAWVFLRAPTFASSFFWGGEGLGHMGSPPLSRG